AIGVSFLIDVYPLQSCLERPSDVDRRIGRPPPPPRTLRAARSFFKGPGGVAKQLLLLPAPPPVIRHREHAAQKKADTDTERDSLLVEQHGEHVRERHTQNP